jgi:PII-like signaling protein
MNKEKDFNIIEQSLGKLQIYVKPREKVEATSLLNSLRSRQLYRELVKYAKDDHVMNASVFQTHHGYSMHGKISSTHVELPNHDLFLCIELIDEKQKLEEYCRKHGKLLKGKMIVFRPVEFWEIK